MLEQDESTQRGGTRDHGGPKVEDFISKGFIRREEGRGEWKQETYIDPFYVFTFLCAHSAKTHSLLCIDQFLEQEKEVDLVNGEAEIDFSGCEVYTRVRNVNP
jgi:hypothetical protein